MIDAVFPALAGMNRRYIGFVRYPIRVPRASGDEPGRTFQCSAEQACSPR